MAAHSSTLAWKIPWTEETGGLQPIGSQSWTRLKQLSTAIYLYSFFFFNSLRTTIRHEACDHVTHQCAFLRPEHSLQSVTTDTVLPSNLWTPSVFCQLSQSCPFRKIHSRTIDCIWLSCLVTLVSVWNSFPFSLVFGGLRVFDKFRPVTL